MERPYISGPMTGKEYFNFPLFFNVEHRLRDIGYNPLNPARRTGNDWLSAYHGAINNPRTWHEYIREDIDMMLDSDGVVLLPGWKKSKGACVELVTSVSIGNIVMEWNHVLDKSTFAVHPIDTEEAYDTALKYLRKCSTGGVDLSGKNYVQNWWG